MIDITFTCDVCGAVERITYDDVEEKRIVPTCDTCYYTFGVKKERLKSNIEKLYSHYHIDCPDMGF